MKRPLGAAITGDDSGLSSSSPSPMETRDSNERQQRRKQYHLVAAEIASVLNDEGDDEDDEEEDYYSSENEETGESSEQLIDQFHSPRRSRRSLAPSQRPLPTPSIMSAIGESPSVSNDQQSPLTLDTIIEHEEHLVASIPSNSSSPSLTVIRRRRKRRHRPPKPFIIQDSEINSYSLFDIMGTSSSGNINHQQQTKNIYAKTYHPSHLFTPILIFLSTVFLILLVIRILVSLATITVGMTILCYSVVKIVQEFWHRPTQFLKEIHRRPYQSWIGLAIVTSLLIHHGERMSADCLNQAKILLLAMWNTTTGAAQNSRGNDVAPPHPYENSNLFAWMIRPCTQGLVYGLTIGRTWILFLGDASNPTKLTSWITDRIWRRLIRSSYCRNLRSMQRRRLQQQRQEQQRHGQQQEKEGRHKYDRECMICLEVFEDEMAGSSTVESARIRQYLPCLHGFHANCLIKWLVIKSTCPICRVQVPSTTTATLIAVTSTAEIGNVANLHARTHPAIHAPLGSIEED